MHDSLQSRYYNFQSKQNYNPTGQSKHYMPLDPAEIMDI